MLGLRAPQAVHAIDACARVGLRVVQDVAMCARDDADTARVDDDDANVTCGAAMIAMVVRHVCAE